MIGSVKRLVLVLAVAAAGCVSSAAPRGAETEQIERRIQESAGAWNRGDLAAFVADYDDSATFVTGNGLVGKEEMARRYAEKYFHAGKPDQTLRFEEIRVRPLGEGFALSTGRWAVSGGGKPDQSGWFSLVWKKTPGGWKIVHDHSS
jgi:uncharacterized protein (TIGR02246 family)